MPKATFRVYEELNDFLARKRRKTDFEAEFRGKRSVKDMIESFGIPHTEVDLILVNGKSVNFDYILKDGDRISVYPEFESFNIEHVTRLRKIPIRKTRFIADINLDDIVKYMRVLGFDVYYDPLLSTKEIIDISRGEKRIILTKSRKLLYFKEVTHGIYIRPGKLEEQIKGIVDYLDIQGRANPFSRCLLCNTTLESVSKDEIIHRIPSKTRDYCDEYRLCTSCDKIYWKGTHYLKMKETVDRIIEPASE